MHWDLWAQRIQSLTESQISGAISRDEFRRCRLLRPANLQQEQSPFLVGKSSISMGHLYHSYHSSASVLVGISLFYQFRYPMRYRWWSMIYKDQPLLVGGFKHFLFFHILDIIIWTNIFQRGRSTTNQLTFFIDSPKWLFCCDTCKLGRGLCPQMGINGVISTNACVGWWFSSNLMGNAHYLMEVCMGKSTLIWV